MRAVNLYIIASICLFSTGHWIGGSVSLGVVLWGLYEDVKRNF